MSFTDIVFILCLLETDSSGFLICKLFQITFKSRVLVMSFSIDSTAKLFGLSCEIVDRKYALISFSLEKPLSPDGNCCGHC